jgi:hypothetical protein
LYDGAAIAFKVTFQDKPTKQLVLTMVFHQKKLKNCNKIHLQNKTMKIKEIQDEIVDEFPCLTTGWSAMNTSSN